MRERYFLDVPIYRVSREVFEHDFVAYSKNVATKHNWGVAPIPESDLRRTQTLSEAFGAPWLFNQIVGFARLFTLGSQLRGDYYLSPAKRLLANPAHKRFEYFGKLFELESTSFVSSADLVASLRTELTGAVRELRKGTLALDLEVFDNILPCVDWRQLFPELRLAPAP